MSVATAIHDLLTSDLLISRIASNGVYPSGQPKHGTIPNFVVHEIIGSDRPPLLDKVCRLTNYQVRITGVCKTESDLRRLMDAIEVRLDGYKGGDVRGCQLQDKSTNPNPDEPTIHSESHTYSVWHVRSLVGGND